MNNLKDKSYFPLKLTVLYLTFTLILYIFSPWDFNTVNPFLTYTLLLLYICAFVCGYCLSFRKNSLESQKFINKQLFFEILNVLLFINCIALFIQMMRSNGFTNFNLFNVWERIKLGFINPSANYYEIQDAYKNNLYSNYMGFVGSGILFIMKPLSYSLLISSAVFFIKLSKVGKILAILNLAIYSLRYIMMGTNKGVMDIVIIILSSIILLYFRGEFKIKKKAMIAGICIMLILGVSYFSLNLGDRYFGKNWMNNYSLMNMVKIKNDSILLKIVPENMKTTVVSLSSYLSQGYFGFSMCTDVSWTPMFGLGNSQNNVYKLSQKNPSIFRATLQAKVENKYGWTAGASWSTLYSWIANDLSIYGVVPFMMLFGYLFAKTYKDAVFRNNEFALVLFVYFMIEIFFIPANNQISISSESELGFLVLLALWLLSRKIRLKV